MYVVLDLVNLFVDLQALLNRETSNSEIQQPSRGSCVDRSAWCASWLSANSRVCQISAIYMRQDCARTCGFC
uniref:ShKT domain-containing protein n=1 Tax=Caenorhabditis tropicalis TaxID=1561998 RepID=A0A1I7T8I3_9PELO